MDSRTGSAAFLVVEAMVIAMLSCSCGRNASVSAHPAHQRPAWVKQGIVMVGNWEPLTFIRRRGGHALEDVENWKAERTEAVARNLKGTGITLVITNLHKGFGLKAEAEDIEATRQFTRYAHKYGLRVGGYIGATMAYETFFREEPAARDWMQVDESGRPLYYNDAQTFRYAACRNNPGYAAFIQRVLRLGIQDMKLDMAHVDQMQGWSEPRACRCGHCTRKFKEFLRRAYKPEQLMLRFGFTDIEDLAPPPYNSPDGVRLASIVNPLMQDWARFRAKNMAEIYAGYGAYIRSLNPDAALEGNPNLNLAMNRGFRQAVDVGQMLEHGDVVWSESQNHASWTGDGRLISKIRELKAARVMGKSLFLYTGGRYGTQDPNSPPELRIAEAMAYNDANLGMVGDVSPEGVHLSPEAKRSVDFFLKNTADLTGTAPVADAAVLRSFASVEFNPGRGLAGAMMFEQALIQSRVPFAIIFDRHLAELERYRVLVLADQEALADDQVEAIRRFVRNGGGLVATGNSSLLTDWGLRRRKFALADVFGLDLPPAGGTENQSLRRTFGKGRVVYIPKIEPEVEPPAPAADYNFDQQYWNLPKNQNELTAAVIWAAGGELSAAASGPPSMTMELAQHAKSESILLHLVNYSFRKPVLNVDARVRIPEGYQVREISIRSPESNQPQVVKSTTRENTVSFRIPRVSVYSLALLRLEKKRN